MSEQLCKHGFVVCEDCAFERGQEWAINRLRFWGAEKWNPFLRYMYVGVAECLAEAKKDEEEVVP